MVDTFARMSERRRLPRAEEAVIPRRKLESYALDCSHPRGWHKARVFRAVLAIEARDWRHLREQIRFGIPTGQVVDSRVTPHGVAYKVTLSIEGLNGATAPVVTTWIEWRGGPPRLTSLWVDIP